MGENAEILKPKRAMIISAHPDDPEFGAGGTVARWTMEGAEVTYVIVTDGSKGSEDREVTPAKLMAIREEEQRAAAAVLGVHKLIFLGYPDGEVYNTIELRGDLVRQLRTHRPDVVVTHDPTARIIGENWINHPDHLAVGDTALNAIFPLARDRLNFPEHEGEGLSPHKVMHVLLTPTSKPTFWMDISATIDRKIEALKKHVSQIGEPEDLAERMRQRAQEVAEDSSFAFGEAFRYIPLRR
jgi:LmbE family N-acetylglucosaminyl deacetylase